MRNAISRNEVFRKPDIPSLKKEGYSAADMHFHSEYSLDAISKINNIIPHAKQLGIGVAITDHNEIKGNLRAAEQSKEVMIIPGIEVTCTEGTHSLYYFYSHRELQDFYAKEISHWKEKNTFKIGYTTGELMERSRDYNCIVCAAHPYSVGATGITNLPISKRMLSIIEAVEVINGYNLHKWNEYAYSWAEELNKGMSAGTDGHTTHELGRTLTYSHGDDIGGFLDAIKTRKSHVIGKEENIFEKALLGILKEETYIMKTHHEKQALKLIKSQFGSEVEYLKSHYNGRLHELLERFKRSH